MAYLERASSIPEYYQGLNVGVKGGRLDGEKTNKTEKTASFALPHYEAALQNIAVYVTTETMFIVASVKDKFRLLYVDRDRVDVIDDERLFTKEQLDKTLTALAESSGGAVKKLTDACGIIGFVQLIDLTFILLITAYTEVGVIGGRRINEVKTVKLFQVSKDDKKVSRDDAAYNERYKTLITDFGLTENCYFSYSYDLTNSLQQNMEVDETTSEHRIKTPTDMYIWNRYLLRNWSSSISQSSKSLWLLPLVKGFFMQRAFTVQGGKTLRLTLIARRSRHWAGTRYLRRGVNDQGFVANEVESEVILQVEGPSGTGSGGFFSSNVMHRGSIPLSWHHTNLSNPKPGTEILHERGEEGTKKHFERLFRNYNAPIVVMNLVKQKESKAIEAPMGEAYTNTVHWLNTSLSQCNNLRSKQPLSSILVAGKDDEMLTDKERLNPLFPSFLAPPDGKTINEVPVVLISFDFLSAKAADVDVMNVLHETSNSALVQTGFFYLKNEVSSKGNKVEGVKQSGVVRVNCMDCLDRTNVAQFCYARTTLRHQMKAVGLDTSDNDYQEVWFVLLKLFEEHGDIIAKQYGGSGAMHKATASPANESKEGKKTANITSGAGNALVAIQRYYSNNVTDISKQQAYNLFHGLYFPKSGLRQIWDETDLMNPYELYKNFEYDVDGRSSLLEHTFLSNDTPHAHLDDIYDGSSLVSLDEFLQSAFNVPVLSVDLHSSQVRDNFRIRRGNRKSTVTPVNSGSGSGGSGAVAPAGDSNVSNRKASQHSELLKLWLVDDDSTFNYYKKYTSQVENNVTQPTDFDDLIASRQHRSLSASFGVLKKKHLDKSSKNDMNRDMIMLSSSHQLDDKEKGYSSFPVPGTYHTSNLVGTNVLARSPHRRASDLLTGNTDNELKVDNLKGEVAAAPPAMIPVATKEVALLPASPQVVPAAAPPAPSSGWSFFSLGRKATPAATPTASPSSSAAPSPRHSITANSVVPETRDRTNSSLDNPPLSVITGIEGDERGIDLSVLTKQHAGPASVTAERKSGERKSLERKDGDDQTLSLAMQVAIERAVERQVKEYLSNRLK